MLIDIRPPLRAFLLADTDGVAALAGRRIFPMRLQQGVTEPSIVYTRISSQGDHTMTGPSGLATVRMQIDAWAKTPDDAVALADAVKERLDGYSGPMVSEDPAITADVQGVFFDSEHEEFDEQAKLHRVRRDYFFNFGER